MVHSIHKTERDPTTASETECLHFHYASGFDTQMLAHMLDSLVRVSRRVGEDHLASESRTYIKFTHSQALLFTTHSFAVCNVDNTWHMKLSQKAYVDHLNPAQIITIGL